MRLLRPNDDTDTEAENEVDEPAYVDDSVDDGTTVRPTFTPADEVADDPAVPDDSAAQTPTLVEPAEDYPTVAHADTVAAPVAVETDEDDNADEEVVETDEPVATYTPVEDTTAEPVTDYTDEPTVDYTDAADEPVTVYDETPVTTDTPVVADAEPTVPVASTPAATPAAAPSLDQPLLSGDTELLTQWQRVQAEFVDDPQVAVAGAADLVEQAGQALVDALQQRQRQMRSLWDHSSDDGSGPPADGTAGSGSDTEQLRLMMQRYRALFNQLYQPV